MSDEVPVPNPPLSPEELSFAAKLTERDIAVIDNAILSCSEKRFQKIAMVVARTMTKLSERYPQLSDVFFAERIHNLADQGRLESQGILAFMRFSEVRIPDEN
jgi:hypothetical protein